MKHIHAKTKAHPQELSTAVSKAEQTLAQAMTQVPGLATMTKKERKSIVKMHTGGERYIESMAHLAQKDAHLCPKGIDPADMLARVQGAASLAELHAGLVRATRTVEDSILARLGSAWHDALDVYASVQSAARRDPALLESLAPMEAFLSTGPRGKAAAVKAP